MLTSVVLDGAGDVSINGSALASYFGVATRGSGNLAVQGGRFNGVIAHLIGYIYLHCLPSSKLGN